VLLNSAQQVIGSDKTREDIQAAIDNIRTTSAATTRISSKLDSLTDSLQEDSESLNKQLGDRLTQINAVLTNLQNITSKVDQGQGTAGMMVNDPRLYEAMVDSLHQLDATVTDLHRLVDQWEQEGLSLKVK
jgi:phospholipid/cholesterol/gamma-HCH transport system substrate-binding protein